MKELKDYLHLYLGCEVMIEGKIKCVLSGFEQDGQNVFKPVIRELHYKFTNKRVNDWDLIKPILRPLSDMSLLEARESCQYSRDAKALREIHTTVGTEIINPALFTWLLSKHFDLFGLIESGLAIDATTLKTDNTIKAE